MNSAACTTDLIRTYARTSLHIPVSRGVVNVFFISFSFTTRHSSASGRCIAPSKKPHLVTWHRRHAARPVAILPCARCSADPAGTRRTGPAGTRARAQMRGRGCGAGAEDRRPGGTPGRRRQTAPGTGLRLQKSVAAENRSAVTTQQRHFHTLPPPRRKSATCQSVYAFRVMRAEKIQRRFLRFKRPSDGRLFAARTSRTATTAQISDD